VEVCVTQASSLTYVQGSDSQLSSTSWSHAHRSICCNDLTWVFKWRHFTPTCARAYLHINNYSRSNPDVRSRQYVYLASFPAIVACSTKSFPYWKRQKLAVEAWERG